MPAQFRCTAVDQIPQDATLLLDEELVPELSHAHAGPQVPQDVGHLQSGDGHGRFLPSGRLVARPALAKRSSGLVVAATLSSDT